MALAKKSYPLLPHDEPLYSWNLTDCEGSAVAPHKNGNSPEGLMPAPHGGVPPGATTCQADSHSESKSQETHSGRFPTPTEIHRNSR